MRFLTIGISTFLKLKVALSVGHERRLYTLAPIFGALFIGAAEATGMKVPLLEFFSLWAFSHLQVGLVKFVRIAVMVVICRSTGLK